MIELRRSEMEAAQYISLLRSSRIFWIAFSIDISSLRDVLTIGSCTKNSSLVALQSHLDQQRPMIHLTHSRVAQNFRAAQQHRFIGPEEIVDAAIINRRVSRVSTQIAKILQRVTVRLAVILHV